MRGGLRLRRGMTGCPLPLDDPLLIHERCALIGKDFRNKSVIAQTVIVGSRQPVFVVEVSYHPPFVIPSEAEGPVVLSTGICR
jgi:hypothetical protein